MTHREKLELAKSGLKAVLSSNVSAVGVRGEDLYIRFHDGSLYQYPGSADLFGPMMKSPSKGSFVWSRIRKPNLKYRLVGSLRLPEQEEVTDKQALNDLTDDRLKGNASVQVSRAAKKDFKNYDKFDKQHIKQSREKVIKTQIKKYKVNTIKPKQITITAAGLAGLKIFNITDGVKGYGGSVGIILKNIKDKK